MPKSPDSDSNTEQGGTSSPNYNGEPRWTLLDLEEIEEIYWATVGPELRKEGYTAETHQPTYEWLRNNDHMDMVYALREYHDYTFGDFWEQMERTVTGAAETEYDWQIRDDDTRDRMQEYIDRRLDHRDGYSDSTGRTERYHLARFGREHYIQHGSDDLLTPIRDTSEFSRQEAIDRAWETADALREELADQTTYKIINTVKRWYYYLESRGVAEYNPIVGLEVNYGWNNSAPSSGDPVALKAEHVTALHQTADSQRDRLLVMGLCAWGLRIGELASLHRQNLHFDDDPYIAFTERKNGPGTVALLFGEDLAKQRIADLQTERQQWNGYLFPSTESSSGHRHAVTLRNWFHDLADRAGVPSVIDGDSRKPHMGRRFWYSAYAKTMVDVSEEVAEIAAEQGSKDENTVLNNYLSESEKQNLRRRFMRQRLKSAFDEDGD
jgi:integrase